MKPNKTKSQNQGNFIAFSIGVALILILLIIYLI